MWQDGIAVIHLLENMPQVTIAMLNGYCFTGAMEIMMAFDLVVAADEAKIGDTHTKWGIPPKWGMTQRLMDQVGMRKAKELSFTAQAISGKEAEKIGLVNKSIQILKNLNYMAIGIGHMKPEPAGMPGLYDHLAHQIWVRWISSPSP